MQKMKMREGERLRGIIKKGQQTTEVFHRIELAKRGKVVKLALEDLDVAREPSEEMKGYSKKEAEVYAKYGTRVTTPDGGTGFRIDDWAPVTKELKALQEENEEIMEADKKAKEDIEKLLDNEIEIDIEPMRNEWFGEFINGDDVEFLLIHDLLDLEEEEEDYDEVPQIPRKKRSPKKGKAKRR